jgi:hypothetical protein
MSSINHPSSAMTSNEHRRSPPPVPSESPSLPSPAHPPAQRPPSDPTRTGRSQGIHPSCLPSTTQRSSSSRMPYRDVTRTIVVVSRSLVQTRRPLRSRTELSSASSRRNSSADHEVVQTGNRASGELREDVPAENQTTRLVRSRNEIHTSSLNDQAAQNPSLAQAPDDRAGPTTEL